jgi:hypothetical protein
MSDATFQIVGPLVMLTIAAALLFVAHRQTTRTPLTAFAIVRAGSIGFAAVYACFLGARMAQHIVFALVLPALTGALLFWCARLFARLPARIAARVCAVLAVLCVIVSMLALFFWATSEPAASEESTAIVNPLRGS